MFKRFFYVMAIIALAACSPKVIVRENTKIQYRDSVITKTDSVEVPVPVEIIREVVPAVEEWKAETSVAEASCRLDTNGMVLRGELKNKPAKFKAPVEKKEEYHQRDSIVYVEIPVRVIREKKFVPKWCWWLLGINILLLAGAGLALWKKFSI